MAKKGLFVIFVLLVGLVIVYRFPVPRPTFEKTYKQVDRDTRQSLLNFRNKYPTRQLEVEGNIWRYVSMGQGSKAILFLHGMTGAYDIWWQQLMDLENDIRVVSLTYPPVKSLSALAQGVRAILKAEEITSVYLVGSSLGGYFGQYLVAKHADLVKKAIFANTFPPNDYIAEKNRFLGKLLPGLPEWTVLMFLRKNTENRIYPASGNSELVKAYMFEQSYGMMSKAQFLARYNCVIDYFKAPELIQAQTPVLIVEADNDPLVAKVLRDLLKTTYPAAPVKSLGKAGHFPYLNAPEEYVRIIRDFFDLN